MTPIFYCDSNLPLCDGKSLLNYTGANNKIYRHKNSGGTKGGAARAVNPCTPPEPRQGTSPLLHSALQHQFFAFHGSDGTIFHTDRQRPTFWRSIYQYAEFRKQLFTNFPGYNGGTGWRGHSIDLFEDGGERVGAGQVEDDVFIVRISHVQTAQLHVTERHVTEA